MIALSILALCASQFTVTERFFSLVSTFDVASNEEPLGVVTKDFFALTPVYTLEDCESRPRAIAKARFFAWGTIADVEDEEGNIIGRIEENLWRVLPWAEYKVYDHQNKMILQATMDFFGTEFTLIDPVCPDQPLAKIGRPFIHLFRDDWSIQCFDSPTPIDSRLLVLLAVYQSDKDNRARFFSEYRNAIFRDLEDGKVSTK